MKNNKTTEAELIRRLKNGSLDSFNKIFELYSKILLAFCIRFTKNQHDAEDIVHSTFLRLWRIKARIRQEDTLKSLLFIIAKSYLIKSYNKSKRHKLYDPLDANHEYFESEFQTDHKAEYNSLFSCIIEEINKLSPTQKAVVEDAKLKGMSSKEIASIHGLSEQTVRNQISLGTKKLKSKLG